MDAGVHPHPHRHRMSHLCKLQHELRELFAVRAEQLLVAMVRLLREPGGRPAGLPLCPGLNRMCRLLVTLIRSAGRADPR